MTRIKRIKTVVALVRLPDVDPVLLMTRIKRIKTNTANGVDYYFDDEGFIDDSY